MNQYNIIFFLMIFFKTSFFCELSLPNILTFINIGTTKNVKDTNKPIVYLNKNIEGAFYNLYETQYFASPLSPEIIVINNTCPSYSNGNFNVVSPCGAGTHIEWSSDGGITWSTVTPIWEDGLSVVARCVDDLDSTNFSLNSNRVFGQLQICCPEFNCFTVKVKENNY